MLLFLRIQRSQENVFAFERRHSAGGENVDGEVHRHRPRMKKIERPEVDGASSKVGAAWSLCDYGRTACGKTVFCHRRNCGIICQGRVNYSLSAVVASKRFTQEGGKWKKSGPESSSSMTKTTSG